MSPFPPFAANPAPTHQQNTTVPVADADPQANSPVGRPRALDGPKRADILELLSGGFDLEHAARQVRCSLRTIRREMKRDPLFAREFRRSEIFSLQNPLGAMQHALHRNWRAAAWLLERMFPDRFGRRTQASAFGKPQARQLLNEVLKIVNAEVIDTFQRERLDGRIRAAFEYRIHVYCPNKRPSTAGMNKAIDWFERKDNENDALANLGRYTPNHSTARNPSGKSPAETETSTTATGESDHRTTHPARVQTVNEALQEAHRRLASLHSKSASASDNP